MNKDFRVWRFTLLCALCIGMLALMTAFTLYVKEVASLTNMYRTMGLDYSLSKAEIDHYRQSAYWSFLIFCLPIVPLLICTSKKPAQVTLVLISVLVLIFAILATPGADRKGCEDCFAPLLISLASTTGFTVFCGGWVIISMVFHFYKASNATLPRK